MKLVIDIPEKMIEGVKNDIWCGSNILNNAIKTGTPYKERPHGEWIPKAVHNCWTRFECSVCGLYHEPVHDFWGVEAKF